MYDTFFQPYDIRCIQMSIQERGYSDSIGPVAGQSRATLGSSMKPWCIGMYLGKDTDVGHGYLLIIAHRIDFVILQMTRSHLGAVSKHKIATVYQCTLSTLAISHVRSSYMTSGVVGAER
jgi:hypothetical protein